MHKINVEDLYTSRVKMFMGKSRSVKNIRIKKTATDLTGNGIFSPKAVLCYEAANSISKKYPEIEQDLSDISNKIGEMSNEAQTIYGDTGTPNAKKINDLFRALDTSLLNHRRQILDEIRYLSTYLKEEGNATERIWKKEYAQYYDEATGTYNIPD